MIETEQVCVPSLKIALLVLTQKLTERGWYNIPYLVPTQSVWSAIEFMSMQTLLPDFSLALDAIARQGYFIAPNFWPDELTAEMVTACHALRAAGDFRPATVGRGAGQAQRVEIRSDWIHWLDHADAPPALTAYLDALEAYRHEVNQHLYLGLFDFEGHAALYPPGAHYGRHLDRFRDDDARTLTTILYLNDDWEEEDGGYLRFYPEGDNPDISIDVAPRRGTFVSFLAADYWHEVLPAQRDRLALTGWFRRRGGVV